MADQIQPFKPESLVGALRERIRDSFGQLIPDAEWDEMLRVEVNRFFHPTKNQWGTMEPSDFGRVVRDIVHDVARKRVQEYLDTSPQFAALFGPGHGAEPAALVEQALSNSIPVLVQEILRGLGEGVRQQIQWRMNNPTS